MKNNNCTFERSEKKFLISRRRFDEFINRLSPYIKEDKYSKYTVYNIYYDTQTDYLIRNSLEKPAYKEKLRLRSYGPIRDEDIAFLEIKKKFDGVVYKRRIELPLQEAMDYLEKGIKPKEDGQIFKEIDYLVNFYKVGPKLFIAYDRLAFSGIFDKELRITVDKNICSRTEKLTLKETSAQNRLLMQDEFLVEIKTKGALPLWLSAILSDMEIYSTSFSKYGSIYTKSLQDLQGDIKCLQVS